MVTIAQTPLTCERICGPPTHALPGAMSGGAPTSSGVEFAKAYAERLKSVQISILASALFAFIVEVAYLGATSGKDPVWAKSLPCTFQTAEVKDELTRVGKAIAALQSALDMVPLLLMIGAIGINAGLCQLAMPTKFPFRAVVVAWLWTTGSMLGLYTFVNVKELTNYQPVSEKACRVALSQLFYPVIPSSSGQDVLDEHKGRTQYVRERANLYFSNKAHYLAKFTRPDLTSLEDPLVSIHVGNDSSITDDTEQCDLSSETAKNALYQSLYVHTTPTEAINEFCRESSKIAWEDSRDSIKSGWPVELASKHFENIINALALARFSCDFTLSPDSIMRPDPNASVSSADVCDYFTTRATLDDVPREHREYLGVYWMWSEQPTSAPPPPPERATGWSSAELAAGNAATAFNAQKRTAFRNVKDRFARLGSAAERQAACSLIQTKNPQTGLPAFKSEMCDDMYNSVREHGGYTCTEAATCTEGFLRWVLRNQKGKDWLEGFYNKSIREARTLDSYRKFGSLLPNKPSVVAGHFERTLWMIDDLYQHSLRQGASQEMLDGINRYKWTWRMYLGTNPNQIVSDGYNIMTLPEEEPNKLDKLAAKTHAAAAPIIAFLRTIQARAAMTTAAVEMSSNQVWATIGIAAGVDVASKLFAFAISCMTGTLAGVSSFKQISRASSRSGRDQEALFRYSLIIVCLVVTVMFVPMMLLPIFMFQSLFSYWFVLSIGGLYVVFASFLWMASIRGLENAGSICSAGFTSTGGGVSGCMARALLTFGWIPVVAGVLFELFFGHLAQYFDLESAWATGLKMIAQTLFRSFITQAFTLTVATKASGYYFVAFDDVVYKTTTDEYSHLSNVAQVEKNYAFMKDQQASPPAPLPHVHVQLSQPSQSSVPVGFAVEDTSVMGVGANVTAAAPPAPRFCNNCGEELDAEYKFCASCGAEVPSSRV